MANTSTIVGYRVKTNGGYYVHHEDGRNFTSLDKPEPISKPDAYRRLAAYLDENPWASELENLYVAPVFYEPSPLEKASKELGGLLQSLCSRHGLDLGLTQEQIEKQIGKELEELKAGGSSFVVTGIPRIGR